MQLQLNSRPSALILRRHEAREIREERRENNFCRAPAKVHHHRKLGACGLLIIPGCPQGMWCPIKWIILKPLFTITVSSSIVKLPVIHKACGVVDHPRVAKEVVDHPKAAAHHHAKKVHSRQGSSCHRQDEEMSLSCSFSCQRSNLPCKEHKDHDSTILPHLKLPNSTFSVSPNSGSNTSTTTVSRLLTKMSGFYCQTRRQTPRCSSASVWLLAPIVSMTATTFSPDPVDDVPRSPSSSPPDCTHRANNDIGPLSDSDNDVRAHVRVNRAVNRGPHRCCSSTCSKPWMGWSWYWCWYRSPCARARAHVRVEMTKLVPTLILTIPRARARARVHAKTTPDLMPSSLIPVLVPRMTESALMLTSPRRARAPCRTTKSVLMLTSSSSCPRSR